MGVGSGMQECAIGGSVESMSRVPMGSDEAMIDGLNMKMRERIAMVPQGISADLIATLEGITREECDQFAWESQQRTQQAVAEGRYKSVVPITDLMVRQGDLVAATQGRGFYVLDDLEPLRQASDDLAELGAHVVATRTAADESGRIATASGALAALQIADQLADRVAWAR